jgi:hypothetical protein
LQNGVSNSPAPEDVHIVFTDSNGSADRPAAVGERCSLLPDRELVMQV